MMQMLMLARSVLPDCEVGEKLTLTEVSGTVKHADEDHVMIQVDSVGEKTVEGEAEGEVEMSPEETAALGKGRKKAPAAMESY